MNIPQPASPEVVEQNRQYLVEKLGCDIEELDSNLLACMVMGGFIEMCIRFQVSADEMAMTIALATRSAAKEVLGSGENEHS